MPDITGSLLYGIEYPADSGQMHYDFAMRVATVADTIAAYESNDVLVGGVSQMRVNTIVYSRCLTRLGSIPADDITPELIGTAVDGDYDVLAATQEDLKKKRQRPSNASETSALPEPSSANTASAPSVS